MHTHTQSHTHTVEQWASAGDTGNAITSACLLLDAAKRSLRHNCARWKKARGPSGSGSCVIVFVCFVFKGFFPHLLHRCSTLPHPSVPEQHAGCVLVVRLNQPAVPFRTGCFVLQGDVVWLREVKFHRDIMKPKTGFVVEPTLRGLDELVPPPSALRLPASGFGRCFFVTSVYSVSSEGKYFSLSSSFSHTTRYITSFSRPLEVSAVQTHHIIWQTLPPSPAALPLLRPRPQNEEEVERGEREGNTWTHQPCVCVCVLGVRRGSIRAKTRHWVNLRAERTKHGDAAQRHVFAYISKRCFSFPCENKSPMKDQPITNLWLPAHISF